MVNTKEKNKAKKENMTSRAGVEILNRVSREGLPDTVAFE